MKKWGALTTLSLAMFIIVIDTTIMNVSISALVVDLNTTVTGIQSAISVYALVMAAFILIGGKLSDIFGKKRIFVIGLAIYGLGTTIASLSGGLGMLIFGWSLLEGLGGALMIPNIQVLLRGEYEKADLAFAYGIIGAVGAVGAAVGPIVGGFFTTYYSWRWAFRTELLIVIIVLGLTRTLKKDQLLAIRPSFDFGGAALSIFGWSSIVFGILLAQKYGFFLAKQPFMVGSAEISPFGLSISPILIGLGFLLIILLFRWEDGRERAGTAVLFKPSLFKIPGMKAGFAVRFVQVGVTAAFLYTFPLLLQLSFELSAIDTGVALMPFSLSLLIFAIVGSRLSSRFTAKRIIQVGFLAVIFGLIAFGNSIQLDIQATELLSGSLFGIGLGLIASQILNLILSAVNQEDTAETAGLTSTFEQLGNSIGVALVGAIMLASLSSIAQQGINASETLPIEAKEPLIASVENGVQLMSDTQLEGAVAGLSAELVTEIEGIYELARTGAFQAGIALLVYFSIMGLLFTLGLQNRKLVEE